MTTAVPGDTATSLLTAIEELRGRGPVPTVRIALAEAEFRLAVAPDTEPAEAIKRLQAAIEQDPFCPKLFLHLGRLLHQSGDMVAAVPQYRHAIRLAPSSRRAHLMLALALLDMGTATRDLGDLLVGALNSGTPADLRAAVADVDAWLEEQAAPHVVGVRKARRPAAKPGTQGRADTWRVRLYEQITRPRMRTGQLSGLLTPGLDRVTGAGEVAEFAIACVLLLCSGQQPRTVRDLGRPVLVEYGGHPAVELLEAALRLAEADDPATFVAMATDYLENGVLPPELVCWSHLAAYGPHRPGTALDAVALLDKYPQPIRDLDCFRELVLVVLDGCAHKAWAGERFAEARLLWQEAASIDQFRVPVALNLALLAARTRSTEDYGPAWERLCELLYLHAAGADDVQVLLTDRKALHLTLAQQAQQRHCSASGPRDTQTPEELDGWLADTDALAEWLTQWDLYYVNARLGFRSPAHLLGVTADAQAEDVAAARDAFVRHVELAVRGQNWAGVHVFTQLVNAQAARAYHAITSNPIRDEYYESERPAAQALAETALGRGLTLRRMMTALRQSPSSTVLQRGYELASRQLALPWKALRQICVERGLIADDVDLAELFEKDLLDLANHWDEPRAESFEEHTHRLSILDACVELLPNRLTLRLSRCLALRAMNKNRKAYAAALAALELESSDDEQTQMAMTAQLIDLVDLIGWEAISRRVREPASAQTAPTREAAINSVRSALARFPRSGLLRRELARLLAATGRVDETNEAIEHLSVGLESALSAEQRAEFAEMLTAIESAAANVSLRESIHRRVEAAREAACAAIDEYLQNTSDAAKKDASAVVRAAIGRVEEGRRMAEQARLADASLDQVLDWLRRMHAELDDGAPNDEER